MIPRSFEAEFKMLLICSDHLASTNWIWTSLNPTDNPIPAREYRSQQDPFTIYSRTARLILDSYTNNTRQTRPLLDLHSEYQATNERRLDHQGQCACVRPGSDWVHSSSDRVYSSSDRVRSGSDRVKPKGIRYGSGSD